MFPLLKIYAESLTNSLTGGILRIFRNFLFLSKGRHQPFFHSAFCILQFELRFLRTQSLLIYYPVDNWYFKKKKRHFKMWLTELHLRVDVWAFRIKGFKHGPVTNIKENQNSHASLLNSSKHVLQEKKKSMFWRFAIKTLAVCFSELSKMDLWFVPPYFSLRGY